MRSFLNPAIWLISFVALLTPAPTAHGHLPPRFDTSQRRALEQTADAFNQVAKKATLSVVSIIAIKSGGAEADELPAGHPYAPFANRSLGVGSGMVIRADGLILTNHHVVDGAQRIQVSFDGRKRYLAKLLGEDANTDIALIKLLAPRESLPVLTLGNSDGVQVGDWALAIGNPFGLNHTVTSGIISAKGRAQMGVFDTEDFIQTDAAINPGNSGGPLLNLDGDVIGMNAAIFSQTGGSVGIGFAIPSNLVRTVIDQILAQGHVVRGWIGVVAQDVDENLAGYFNVPVAQGALISDVAPNGPAARAHLRHGDVILRFNQTIVDGSSSLKTEVANAKAGSSIPLEVMRQGKRENLTLVIGQQPVPPSIRGSQQAGQAAPTSERALSFGLAIRDVPGELRHALGGPVGGALVVGVETGGRAFDAGVEPGDIILKANQLELKNAQDFQKFSQKNASKTKPVVLYIQRGLHEHLYIGIAQPDGA